jgi:hypothetical protein
MQESQGEEQNVDPLLFEVSAGVAVNRQQALLQGL